MLACHFKTVTVPKLGYTEEENEDRFSAPVDLEEMQLRFAVADGATEASFSKEWAALLVTSFQDRNKGPEDLAALVAWGRIEWQSLIDGIPMPWYAEQKASAGAFATLLGIQIDRQEQCFDAYASGDCTLFHIRNNQLVNSFPIQESVEFGNTPDLLCSVNGYGGSEQWLRYQHGRILAGDGLILATDAIAAWILSRKEQDDQPWFQLDNLLSCEDAKNDFTNWLNQKRQAMEIKNDDVTLLLISLI
jgi:hypothetical protein